MIKTTPTSGSAHRPLATGCAILLALAAPSFGQVVTGQFSQANLGTGNFDAEVGLSPDRHYVLAVNLGVELNLTINGVGFQGIAGANPVGTGLNPGDASFTLTGVPTIFPGGQTNPGGVLGQLTNNFVYGSGSTPETLTVSNLTPGESYVITFYNRSWEANGGRRQGLTASGASTVGAGYYPSVDQDIGATGQGSLNVLRYTFRANTSEQVISIAPVLSGTTFHQYGFSVERIFSNAWEEGEDWTTATWNGPTPITPGSSAYLPAQVAPTSINADQDFSVGHLQFEGESAWTITGAPERTISLQADVGGVSMISVNSGTHTVSPNIALQNNLIRSGSGTLVLDGAVSGDYTLLLTGGVTRLTGENTFTGETIIGLGAVLEVTSLSDYGVPSAIGARALSKENTTVTGVGLHFQGGTLRFVGDTPQSTNRYIRVLNGNGATIEASGTTPEATLSFTQSGPNINLFDTGGVRTLTLGGTNTGENTFGLLITNQASNATNITKTGPGTWYLTNPASTYGGVTTIEGGILNVATLSDYGAPSSIGNRSSSSEAIVNIGILFRGGTLQYTGSTPQSTNRSIRISSNGGAVIDASGSNPNATLSFTAAASTDLFEEAGTRTLTLTGTNTGENTFNIRLDNQSSNPTHLTKSGSGTWYITNPANTYGGVTTLEGGILNVATLSDYGSPSSLGNRAADMAPENVGLLFRGGTLQYTGSTPQSTNRAIRISTNGGATIDASGSVPSATLSFTAESSPDFFENPGNRTLTLTGSNRGENTFGMAITQTGGTTTLNKNGLGTWVLTGASTHSGATNVNEGTLLVNGSLGNSSVIVAPGATFGGSGTIGGHVQVNTGALLSPGSNGVGTLTVHSLTLAPFSLLEFEMGDTWDRVNVFNAGGLNIGGGVISLVAEGGATPWTTNGTYPLFGYFTNYVGTVSNLSVFNAQFGKTYAITDNLADHAIEVTIGDAGLTEWNGGAANGLWTTAGNWTAGTPNAVGAAAKFGSIPGSPTSIAVDGAKTVGSIQFDNTNGYTITGGAGDAITFNNGAAAGVIDVVAGSHTITAPLFAVGNLNTQVADGSVLILANSLTGFGGIAHSGNGTLLLTADNQYGPTLISGGTVQVGDGGATGSLGSFDVLMEPGTELHINRSNAYSLDMDILGPEASLTKSGAGSLTLNGTAIVGSAGNGRVTVNDGALILGNASALPSNIALTVNDGTLDLNGTSLTPRDFELNGGTVTDLGTTPGTTTIALNLSGTRVVTGALQDGPLRSLAVTLNSGNLQIGDGGTTGDLAVSSLTLFPGSSLVLNRGDDFTIPANISGSQSTITKLGAGVVTLSGSNNFPTLNVEDGVVRAGSANAVTAATAVNLNAGALDLNGFSVTSGRLTGAGVITDTATSAGTSTLTVSQDINSTFSGSIHNGTNRTVGLAKTGNGTLILAGANTNTYTGLTTITGGTLVLQKPGQNVINGDVHIGDAIGSDVLLLGASDQIDDSAVLTFTAGADGNSAFFRLGGFNETIRGITTTTAQAAVIENTTPETTSTLTINTAGNDYTYDGIIRQSGTNAFLALVKQGAGTLTLANTAVIGANNFTGGTRIEEGKLVLEDLTAFASPIEISNTVEDALVINQTRTLILPGVISGEGGIIKNGPGLTSFTGNNTITGSVTVNDGLLGIGHNSAFGTATIVMNGGQIRAVNAAREIENAIIANASFAVGRLTTFNGPITLTTDLTITADNPDGPANNPTTITALEGPYNVSFAEGPNGIGTGSILLTGTNTTSGTTMESGRVTVTATGGLSGGPLTVNGGELLLQNDEQSVSSLSGTGGLIDLATGHTLIASQEVDAEFAGALRGSGNFIKNGPGELALSGDSPTFSGDTTVNSGALVVNGDLSSSFVQLNGASLRGEGSVGGVNSLGGTIAPGAGVGTLSMADLTLDENSSWSFQLGAPEVVGSGVNDLIQISGSLTLDGTLFVSPVAGFNSGTYTLALYSGSLTDNGLEIDAAFLNAYPGSELDLSTAGEVNLIVVIPEPGTGVLLLGGMAMALGLRRRRRA